MADYSVEALTTVPKPSGNVDIFQTGNTRLADAERNKSRKSATLGEKFDSMIDAAGQNHLASDIGTAIIEANYFDDDPSFELDDDTAVFDLQQNKLSMKYFPAIRNSKSQAEKTYQILKAKREMSIEEKINNSLTDNQRLTASILGTVGDVDMLAGFGVGMLYGAGTKFSKVMALEGFTEANLIAARSILDKNYSMEDAFIDGSIGLMAAGGSAKLSKFFHNRKERMYGQDIDYINASKMTDSAAESARKGFEEFDPNASPDIEFDVPTRQSTIDTINVGKKKQRKANIEKERARIDKAKKTEGTPEFKAEQTRLEAVRAKIGDLIGKKKIKGESKPQDPDAPLSKDGTIEPSGIIKGTERLVEKLEPMLKEVGEVVQKLVKGMSRAEAGQFKQELKQMGTVAGDVKGVMKKDLDKKDIETIAKKNNMTPTQKKMLIGTVALLSTTGAFAGEDDWSEEITGAFLAVGIGLVGGSALLSKIKRTDMSSFKATMSSLGGRVEQAYKQSNMETSPEAGLVKRVGNLAMDSVSTRMTSTVAPFMKAGGEVMEIMNNLVFSAKGGSGAEVTKAMWGHSLMFKYSSFESKYFGEWKLENKITQTANMFNDMKAIHRFRQELTDAMDNVDVNGNRISSGSPALDAMAKENDKLMESIYARATEYGVTGFEKIKYKKGMVNRFWNASELNTLIQKLDNPDDINKFKSAIANAIAKTSGDIESASKTAEEMVNRWQKGVDNTTAYMKDGQEDLWGSLGNLMKDDVEYNDFLNAMGVIPNKSNRAKYRIKFDINDLDPFEIMVDGKPVMVDKAVFTDRDFKSILDKVSNQLFGSSALAKNGYPDRKSLNVAIRNSTDDPKMRNELMQVADLVEGIPIASNNPFLHDLSMIVKDLTMVAKLPLVVFSMPPEFISTIANGGFFGGLKALGKAFASTYGESSYMMRQLSEVSGLGTSTTRIDVSGYRGLTDDVTNLDDAGVASALRAGTMKLRDLSMLMNGLSYFSDVAQRANLAINSEKLAKYFTGDTGRIADTRAFVYGIDDDMIARFKDKFTFKNGELQDFDMSKWDIKDQDDFGEMLRVMNQETSPETTIGETGLYTKTTDLGRAMSSLISYPMQQFNIHGVDDFRHMDRMAFAHSVGGFMGAYIGLNARYAVQDKEVDDEAMMMYALLNVPQLGGYSAITSLLDPATFQMMKSASDIMSIDAR